MQIGTIGEKVSFFLLPCSEKVPFCHVLLYRKSFVLSSTPVPVLSCLLPPTLVPIKFSFALYPVPTEFSFAPTPVPIIFLLPPYIGSKQFPSASYTCPIKALFCLLPLSQLINLLPPTPVPIKSSSASYHCPNKVLFCLLPLFQSCP